MVVDFPLQGDFLAKAKNHRAPLPGVPWIYCLWAHALICGGAVWAVTGSLWLGVCEAGVHCWTDYLKNEGVFGFLTDQALHLSWKLVWVWALSIGVR